MRDCGCRWGLWVGCGGHGRWHGRLRRQAACALRTINVCRQDQKLSWNSDSWCFRSWFESWELGAFVAALQRCYGLRPDLHGNLLATHKILQTFSYHPATILLRTRVEPNRSQLATHSSDNLPKQHHEHITSTITPTTSSKYFPNISIHFMATRTNHGNLYNTNGPYTTTATSKPYQAPHQPLPTNSKSPSSLLHSPKHPRSTFLHASSSAQPCGVVSGLLPIPPGSPSVVSRRGALIKQAVASSRSTLELEGRHYAQANGSR